MIKLRGEKLVAFRFGLGDIDEKRLVGGACKGTEQIEEVGFASWAGVDYRCNLLEV